jgi:hypothetical protein
MQRDPGKKERAKGDVKEAVGKVIKANIDSGESILLIFCILAFGYTLCIKDVQETDEYPQYYCCYYS